LKVKELLLRREREKKKTDNKKTYAKENEEHFKNKALNSLKLKDAKFESSYTNTLANSAQKKSNRANLDAIMEFHTEQVRRIFDMENDAKLKLISVQQQKIDALQEINSELKNVRPIVLDKINRLQRTGISLNEINGTPGPGTYELATKLNSRGGQFGASRKEQRPSTTPAPGYYDQEQDIPLNVGGAIPFMGRGKTDVDLLIYTASKLPGVGQYNLSPTTSATSSPVRSVKNGAIPFQSRGKTDIDRLILDSSKLPGVGAYNLDSSRPKSRAKVLNLVSDLNSVGYNNK
jgi:hypothetical protein